MPRNTRQPPSRNRPVSSVHPCESGICPHGRRLNQTPHRSFGHSGRPRRGRSIEKDQKLNMDAQDAQDKQDEGLLRGELTPAMIRCGRPQFSKRDPPGSAGVPPAPSLAQPRPSPPLGSTGNGAMALLRPGRCGYRRRSGCLQSRAEAQPAAPKGQHAGGTPALPGGGSRSTGWLPAARGTLSGSQRDSMRAGRPMAPRQGCSRRQGGCLQHRT